MLAKVETTSGADGPPIKFRIAFVHPNGTAFDMR
jgi:hypothetical protein